MKQISYLLITLFVSLNCGSSLALDNAIDRAAQDYLSTLESTAAPIFYSTCKTKTGTAVLLFSLQRQQGMLMETRNEVVVNSAPVMFKDDSIVLDIEETQGGIYTYTIMQNHAKDLADFHFKLVSPQNLYRLIKIKTTEKCLEKPPTH